MNRISRFMLVLLVVLIPLSAVAQRNVLLEQFTGTWCGWCPYGVEVLKGLKHEYGDNLIVVTYHARDTLAFADGDELLKIVTPYYPSAMVDRIHYPEYDKRRMSREDWKNAVDYRMDVKEKISISLEGTKYNQSTRTVDLTASIEQMTREFEEGTYRINVVLTENEVKARQKIFQKPYKYIEDYYHQYVARDMITDPGGKIFEITNLEPKKSHVEKFSFAIPAELVEEQCSVVIWVNKDDVDGLGPVLNAQKVSIKSLLPPPAKK